jgi:hypothetical protein
LTSPKGLTALDTPRPGPDPSSASSEDASVSHELSVALSRIQPPSLQARVEAKEKGQERKREGVVVACSALKKEYRDLLRGEEATLVVPPPEEKEIEQGKHLHKEIETFFVYREYYLSLLYLCSHALN